MSAVTPLSLAAFAHSLATASTLEGGLRVLRAQLDEIGRGLDLAFFRYDARRQVVVNRLRAVNGRIAKDPVELSLDHLPPKLKRGLLSGASLVDFGDRSAEYLKFFGVGESSEGFLLAQAVRFDGELWGLLTVHEPRQRFGSRAAERIATVVGIFVLAATQMAQYEARKHAEESLEKLLARVHDEYSRSLAELRAALSNAQTQLTTAGASARVAELEHAARMASGEAKAVRTQLAAVEKQVAVAVTQLEKAHVDLSRQAEIAREQSRVLHEIEQIVAAGEGQQPGKVLQEIRGVVSRK